MSPTDNNTQLHLLDAAQAPADFLEQWPECSDFYRATQYGAIPGFHFGYLIAYRGKAREAVVPYFVTKFKFNTMLEAGPLKHLLGGSGIHVACVGHPTVSFGRVDGNVTAELLEEVFRILSAKAPVVAFKGFESGLPVRKYSCVQALPIAVLHLGADFWDSFPTSKTRNDIRNILKTSASLRFEEHDGLPARFRNDVHKLYKNTYDRAAVKFECLSPEYFSNTSSLSLYLLAFLGDELVGFGQLIPKGHRAVLKYVGMNYAVNRQHAIYFALFLRAMDVCLKRGIKEIEYGETAYGFKKEIGCELVGNWMYYRHRNPFLNAVLSRFAFVLKPSRNELR